MQRSIAALTEKEFDLVVVGGGIFGACAAWDAALRGLSVALVERGDFCEATSANHFKMIHGGVRYLQHGDINRIRESSRERSALLRIAPHLTEPLPIVIPTYGHGLQGKEFLGCGLRLYDLLTFDRNRYVEDLRQQIPPSRFISREECLRLYPGIEKKGLTGAAIFCDGQIYNPPRLALSFIQSAAERGAIVGNYMEVEKFLLSQGQVSGVEVRDRLDGATFSIRGKMVLNATGPWAQWLLKSLHDSLPQREFSFSRDAYFVVRRPLVGNHALTVSAATSDPDAVFSRGNRHLFLVPWRNYTLVGVWHVVHTQKPDDFTVTEGELITFLNEVNSACPWLNLSLADISRWHAGLVLFGENKPGEKDLSFGKRSQLIDHEKENNCRGLISLIGVRATTARGVAEKAIDLVVKKLGKTLESSQTACTPIFGGQIESFDEFLAESTRNRPSGMCPSVMQSLCKNYGINWKMVLRYAEKGLKDFLPLGTSDVLKAEIRYAVKEEMAQKLSDVVLRRTDLATGEWPGDEALQQCAEIMAIELCWDTHRVKQEIDEVKKYFPSHVFRASQEIEKPEGKYCGVL